MQEPRSLAEAGIQPRLITLWQECHAKSGSADAAAGGVSLEEGRFESEEQRAFYSLCASYKDVFFPMRPYPTRCASTGYKDVFCPMRAYPPGLLVLAKRQLQERPLPHAALTPPGAPVIASHDPVGWHPLV